MAYPKTTVGVFVLLVALSAWFARDFRIDASADTLLTEGNRHYVQTQLMNQRFSPQEFLVIAYQPSSGTVIDRDVFDRLDALADRVGELERVESVRSITDVPLLLAADAGLESGVDTDALTIREQGYSLEKLREVFAGHPIYEDLIINPEQTVTALQVLFRSDPQLQEWNGEITELQKTRLDDELTQQQKQRLATLETKMAAAQRELDQQRVAEIKQIRDIIADFDADADIYLGGVHVLGYQLISIIKNDLMVFGAAITGIIALMLLLILRSIRWVLIAMGCCAVSVVLTVGLFGLLGLKATVISANFVALQVILTLALVIHLIVQYREFRQQHDEPHLELVQRTMQEKLGPCFFAGVTTSAGFASLLISGVQPVISFGWMMIVATAVSLLTSLLLFPALLRVCFRNKPNAQEPWFGAPLNACHRLSVRFPNAIALAALVTFSVLAVGATRVSVENSFIDYFSDDTRVHKELSFIDRELGGTTPLDIVVDQPSEQTGQLEIQAETVQTLQTLQERLNELEGVGKTMSLVNFAALARELNGGKPLTEYELTAIYRLMDPALRDDLIGSYYSEAHAQTRLNARIQDTTEGLNREALMRSVREALADVGLDEKDYSLTNLFVLYQDILQRMVSSQLNTLGAVFAAIALVFLLVFRSLKVALIALAPNLITTAAVFGVMGWLSIPLNLMTITIASVAMGIAADDTIHYVHRYRRLRRDQNAETAVRNSHHSVGYAMCYTTFVLMLGFAMLVFSDFVPSVLFGLLTAMAMFVALASSLLVLPALLYRYT